MKNSVISALVLMALGVHADCCAQAWATFLSARQAIDWSDAGVGGIPARKTNCANLTPSATLAQINSALASCASGQTVFLAAGTYSISGTVIVPSDVTLRGAGASRTILNAIGAGGGDVISLGSGSVAVRPFRITNGATAGSTSIEVSKVSGVKVGMYLVIAEINNLTYVSAAGSGGNCNWCDGGWTEKGSLARGQIVKVTGVNGRAITFLPGLYSAYTNTPLAVPFNMAVDHAGVEDLKVYANNTGYSANFGMSECAYCWIEGVESNYTWGA